MKKKDGRYEFFNILFDIAIAFVVTFVSFVEKLILNNRDCVALLFRITIPVNK